jgi:hypothetical protein
VELPDREVVQQLERDVESGGGEQDVSAHLLALGAPVRGRDGMLLPTKSARWLADQMRVAPCTAVSGEAEEKHFDDNKDMYATKLVGGSVYVDTIEDGYNFSAVAKAWNAIAPTMPEVGLRRKLPAQLKRHWNRLKKRARGVLTLHSVRHQHREVGDKHRYACEVVAFRPP